MRDHRVLWTEMAAAAACWAFVWAYGTVVAITMYWTLSGHCCGIPLVTTEWDACLPVQDRLRLSVLLDDRTVCDATSWKRRPRMEGDR